MSDEAWFEDEADAKKYLGEVARIWLVWLGGLIALAASRGFLAAVFGVALLVVMFVLISPLQNRVHERFGDLRREEAPVERSVLAARDRALRDLTYGRRPFAEALATGSMWPGLKAAPWLVTIATFVAAAVISIRWFGR